MQYIFAYLAALAAVNGSPVPQGVTEDIAPQGGMPAGCKADYPGTFGIAVMTGTAPAGPAATEMADGQPAVNQIADGQVGHFMSSGELTLTRSTKLQAMTQIADGQVQAPMPTCAASQIADGQPQAGVNCMMAMPAQQIGDGQVQAQPTAGAVSQINDGQVQAQPTAGAVSQINDGQVQAQPTGGAASQIGDGQVQAQPAASQIGDGQVQATAVGTMADSQPTQAAGSGMSSGMTACQTDSTLEMTLMNGVLHDNQGRTGYIAANYQFQFDAPAQTGAIYTAGFSVCDDGLLALGDQKTWYRCRSGDFFNLYSQNWAPQCEPITIMAVDLVPC